MVYLKSLLAGLASLFVALLLGIVVFFAWGWWVTRKYAAEGGLAVIPFARGSASELLIIAGLIFLAGFYWQFRRARRAGRPLE